MIFTILLATMSIVLNSWLVPKWDITGGALASLGSYLVYFVLLLAFVKWKVGVMPLSKKLIPVAAIVLALFAFNWLWESTLTPSFAKLFAKLIFGLGINAVLKSVFFLALGVTALYKLKVSQSVNDLVEKAMGFLKKRR